MACLIRVGNIRVRSLWPIQLRTRMCLTRIRPQNSNYVPNLQRLVMPSRATEGAPECVDTFQCPFRAHFHNGRIPRATLPLVACPRLISEAPSGRTHRLLNIDGACKCVRLSRLGMVALVGVSGLYRELIHRLFLCGQRSGLDHLRRGRLCSVLKPSIVSRRCSLLARLTYSTPHCEPV